MGGWIFRENLKPFVALLAQIAGYDLYDEDSDWVAIKYGIKNTNVDADQWHTHLLAGAQPLTLELALNPGSRVVSVYVRSATPVAPEVAAQLDLLIDICQLYEVRLWG